MNDRVRRLRGSRWSALLALSLLLLTAPAALAMPAPPSLPPPSYSLYLGQYAETQYTPVDPMTLADLTNRPPLTLPGVAPQLLFSTDGSTIVAIRRGAAEGAAEPDTVVIRDGMDGPERLRFTLPNPADDAWLSPTGDLLAISQYLTSGSWLWQVFDTYTGRIVAAVQCGGGERAATDFIDPDGRRLYHAFYETPAESSSGSMNRVPVGNAKKSAAPPWQLWIAAYDVTTGKETAQIAVPGVTGGTWPRGNAIVGDPIMETEQPAVAFSPDGTRLAVVDAAGTRVTVIDARTLTVTASHALHRPESAMHRFLRWLGIMPTTAEAKFMAGHELSAVFAPDGQHLYLFGIETSVDAAKQTMHGTGFGVRRIDVATGAVTATALAGAVVDMVLPAPDGHSLYVDGPTTPWWENQSEPVTYELRRLDAQTLAPLAERTFSNPPRLVLMPKDRND